jgi:integrase/recombinase XerD
MYEREQFTNEFISKLDGKISDDDLKIVLLTMQNFTGDFDITRRETSLAQAGEFVLPQCYKSYLVAKKIEGRSIGTIQNYDIHLRDFLITVNKNIEEITADDIRIYLYNYQKSRNTSDRYMDSKRLVLNGFFEWCEQEGYVKVNVCKRIKPIKYEEKPRVPLSDIELEKLRRACKNERETAIIETLYSTGCRVTEMCNLKRNDIDFETRTVYLFGKREKHRLSYLNAKAIVSLEEYMKAREDDLPYVFVSERRPYRKLNKSGMEYIVRNIGIRAGLERNIFPHLVRHTMATDSISNGMEIFELSKLLGHEKLETTMIYAKIQQENVRLAHRRCIH